MTSTLARPRVALKLLLTSLLCAPAALWAQDAPPDAQTTDRPRIGLVLSGGGARGAVHIGVIKVLEELNVPIDAIAGTSMGAVVGGLYASGLTAAEVERVMRSVNWQEAFDDRPPRADLTFRRKQEDRAFLVRLPLGLRGGEFLLPRGLIQGQRLSDTLRRLTLPVSDVEDFDRLPTRFRAVATDLETGDRIVLDRGDLPLAMRASLSAPGVFTPVDYEGRVLVDGGLADNLPVDVAREMGVDVLIVVDAGFPLLKRDRLSSVPTISNQMLAILIRRNSSHQRASLTERDVIIDPAIGEASSFDFVRFPKLIDLGEDAARAMAPALAKLSAQPRDYQRYATARAAIREGRDPQVDFIRADAGSARYVKPIEAIFSDFVGKPLDPAEVGRRVTELYGQGNLEVLDYRLVREGDEQGLEFKARRNSWGPNYVRFGLSLSDDFEGNSAYNAGARFVLAEINSLGAEWVWDLQVGESPRLSTEMYLPLTYTDRYFFLPSMHFVARNVPVFAAEKRIAEYRVRSFDYGLDFGREFGTSSQVSVGVRWLDGTARVRLGDPTLPSADFAVRQYSARYAYDRLDDVNFPRRGSSLFVEWLGDRSTRTSADDADLVTVDWLTAHSIGRNTGVLWVSGGSDVSSGPSDVRTAFTLGGFLNLSGLAPSEIAGEHYAIARALYYRQVGRGGEGFLDLPAYIGVSYEIGNVWNDRSDIGFSSARHDGSVFLGLDTLLGPVYVGAGFDDEGETAYYLSLGRTF